MSEPSEIFESIDKLKANDRVKLAKTIRGSRFETGLVTDYKMNEELEFYITNIPDDEFETLLPFLEGTETDEEILFDDAICFQLINLKVNHKPKFLFSPTCTELPLGAAENVEVVDFELDSPKSDSDFEGFETSELIRPDAPQILPTEEHTISTSQPMEQVTTLDLRCSEKMDISSESDIVEKDSCPHTLSVTGATLLPSPSLEESKPNHQKQHLTEPSVKKVKRVKTPSLRSKKKHLPKANLKTHHHKKRVSDPSLVKDSQKKNEKKIASKTKASRKVSPSGLRLKGLAKTMYDLDKPQFKKQFPKSIYEFVNMYGKDATYEVNSQIEKQKGLIQRINLACSLQRRTSSQLAEIATGSRQFIQGMKPGNRNVYRNVRLLQIAAIAHELKVHPIWLLNGNGDMYPKDETVLGESEGAIRLQDMPRARVCRYLRTQAAEELPESVRSFITQYLPALYLNKNVDIDFDQFLNRLDEKLKEHDTSYRKAGFKIDPRKPHLVIAMRKEPSKISLIDFCALSIALKCNPFWLAGKTDETQYHDKHFKSFSIEVMQTIFEHCVSPIDLAMSGFSIDKKSFCRPFESSALSEAKSRFIQQFSGMEILPQAQLINGRYRYTSKKLARSVQNFIDAGLPTYTFNRQRYKVVYTNMLDSIKQGNSITPLQVISLSNAMQCTPATLLSGKYQPKPSYTREGFDATVNTVRYENTLAVRLMRAGLFSETEYSISIRSLLESRPCLDFIGLKDDSERKVVLNRIDFRSATLGLTRDQIFRMIYNNPNVRTYDFLKVNMNYVQLCGFAHILGVRPQWLLAGEEQQCDPEQTPHMIEITEHEEAHHNLLKRLSKEEFEDSKKDLPTEISMELQQYYGDPSSKQLMLNDEEERNAMCNRMKREALAQNVSLNYLGIFVTGFEKSVTNLVSKRCRSVDRLVFTAIAYSLNLSPHWLKTGNGQQYLEPSQPSLLQKKQVEKLEDIPATPPKAYEIIDSIIAEKNDTKISDNLKTLFFTFCKNKSVISNNSRQEGNQLKFKDEKQRLNFIKRLELAANAQGLVGDDLARGCNKPGILTRLKHNSTRNNERSFVSFYEIACLSLLIGVNPDWLATGEGIISLPEQKPLLIRYPSFCKVTEASSKLNKGLKKKSQEKLESNPKRHAGEKRSHESTTTSASKRSKQEHDIPLNV
ncbi:hypothetical protein [Parashewanella spongiae]|uniref:hypothetical protein n=1 Tax=Parashewanella spongiae TaxID=342950 RepID=UPI001C553C9D|nr:hypothetical protein [Parashewanella spongiae]